MFVTSESSAPAKAGVHATAEWVPAFAGTERV